VDIQEEINSMWSKTLYGDLKDGVVMIPFIDCLWDDTCFLHFKFGSE
jgi:hypothetical protein